MNQFKTAYYIGYLGGDKGVLYPDVFTDNTSNMNHYIGKPWGSYMLVAGPFDSVKQARESLSLAHQAKMGMLK